MNTSVGGIEYFWSRHASQPDAIEGIISKNLKPAHSSSHVFLCNLAQFMLFFLNIKMFYLLRNVTLTSTANAIFYKGKEKLYLEKFSYEGASELAVRKHQLPVCFIITWLNISAAEGEEGN